MLSSSSLERRAVEVVTWSNAASALAVGGVVVFLTWSHLPVHAAWIGAVAGLGAFVALRVSLTHRLTRWIAAAFGTLTIAALGGGLAWLFSHVLEMPSAPSVAAVLGAALSAVAPAWSYAHHPVR